MTSREPKVISTAHRVLRNSAWLFSAEVLSKVLALGIQIIAARYIGAQGFGIFSFAFSVTGILMIFGDCGVNIFLTREIARNHERMVEYMDNAFLLKGILTSAAVLVLAFIPYVSKLDNEARWVLWAIGLALVLNAYAGIYVAAFRAFEQMPLVSILNIAQRALFFAAGLIVLLLGYRTIALAVVFLAVAVGAFLASWWLYVSRMEKEGGRYQWNTIKKIFHDSLPIGGIILFSYIYFRIDAIMLYYMRGEAETGWYSAAFKLIEALVLLIASAQDALFPLLSKTFGEKNDRFRNIWKEVARYMLLLGLPMALGTALLAPRLAFLLYGASFETTGMVLQVMALAIPFLFLNNLANQVLVSADRAGDILKIVAIGSIINIALNLTLITGWGTLGAAWANVLTGIAVFALYYKNIGAVCGDIGFLSVIWRPLVSAMGMAFILRWFFSLPLVPLAVIGMIAYFGFLFVLRTFTDRDRFILSGLLHRS